jgi:phage gp36-like protein
MISLSKARYFRPVKVPESILHKSCCSRAINNAVLLQLSYYTQLSQKSKAPLGDVLLFSVLPIFMQNIPKF